MAASVEPSPTRMPASVRPMREVVGLSGIRISICSRACLCGAGRSAQHLVLAGRVIAGIRRQHFFEERRRVLGEFVLLRNQRQHAQGLDVVRLAPQVARIRASASRRLPSASMLRAVTTSVARVASLATCCAAFVGLLRAPDHRVQRCQHSPAGRQGRVQFDGPRERLDRLRRLLSGTRGNARAPGTAAGRSGCMSSRVIQRRQRLGHAAQVAQRHGAHVEQVAVPGGVREQAVGSRPARRRIDAARSDCCSSRNSLPELGRRGQVGWGVVAACIPQ